MKLIPLTQGYIALVDDTDYERVVAAGPWHAFPNTNTVYARAHAYEGDKRVTILMHRFILGLTDPKQEGDHRNGYGMDNRRCNLRPCLKGQNQANRRKVKPASSKYRGVSWNKKLGKWTAYLNFNRKRIYLGVYEEEELAARVYDAAARWKFGEFALCNFPRKKR